MNLIGNSCVASYITRDILKQSFMNPFTWCILDFESCYNLVKFWDSIDFNNFEIAKDSNWNFFIVVDNKVKINYVHYKFSMEHNKITIINNDIYFNKIWEYIVDKYIKRIQNIRNEKPIFIFATANYGLSRHKPFTLEEQYKLADLNSPYKIIFSFKENIISNKVICINQQMRFRDNGLDFSKYIFNNCEVFNV